MITERLVRNFVLCKIPTGPQLWSAKYPLASPQSAEYPWPPNSWLFRRLRLYKWPKYTKMAIHRAILVYSHFSILGHRARHKLISGDPRLHPLG